MTKELTYKQAGDYLIPDLTLDGAEELEEMPLGKYGMLRETFLEDHHHGTYTSMLLTGPGVENSTMPARSSSSR